MECGVRFCGGCNPRYDRGLALAELGGHFAGKVKFSIAKEGNVYDLLLVIGGCPSCCAAFEQYETAGPVLKMWDLSHLDIIISKINQQLNN